MWVQKKENPPFKGTKKFLFWFLDMKGVEIGTSSEDETPIFLGHYAN